ncbi:MAG: hypothetical protein Kow0047_25160 [Anaerolineae bacterium]
MERIGHAIRLFGIWELNGLLAILYVAWEHAAGLLVAAAFAALLKRAPQAHRPWGAGIGILCVLAALLSPSPVPVLLALMATAGAVAVHLDRMNPDVLRWRAMTGLALYALAGLGFLAYSRYLGALDATAWAQAIGGQEEAVQTLAQGRAFINTLATWGLWLILPLGYLSLLLQGLLAHPPLPAAPEQIITSVRTRQTPR